MRHAAIWSALGVSFVATLLTTPLFRRLAWRVGLLDRPNERSSHQQVTPRVGGIAIVVGLTVALLVVGVPSLASPGPLALLGGALLVAGVGLLDDRFGLPPWPRLTAHLIAATGLVWATGGVPQVPLPAPLDLPLGVAGPPVAVLWIVGVVNFFNFMDGIDGLAGLQGLLTAGLVAVAFGSAAPAATLVAVALAGSCAAFLVYNWPPASVFLGDAGSGLLGYALASLALLAPSGRESEAVLMVAVSLWLFLADAGSCLARRVLRGSRWHEAHREHLYQRWTTGWSSHARVSTSIGLASLVLTGLALAGWWTGEASWYWAALGAGAAMTLAEWALVRRLEGNGKGARDDDRAGLSGPQPRR
jgi:Fuc2NAc and GlcNAc transferase